MPTPGWPSQPGWPGRSGGPGQPATDEDCLFQAELVLVGPLAAVRVQGSRGATLVRGPLRAGERRTLAVAVLECVPLWRQTLASLAPPPILVEGRGEGGAASLTGFAREQPLERLERLPWGLAHRPLPRPSAPVARLPVAALCAVVAALALSLAARRRPLLLVLVALGGGGLVLWSVHPGGPDVAPVAAPLRVLEADLAARAFVQVAAASDELELGFDALSVEPRDAPLAIECDLDGRGSVRSAGALLVGRRVVADPGPLDPGHNELDGLEAVWVRRGGSWSHHGAWARGEALGPEQAGPPPPGWLADGLPPGTDVLLARRTAGAGWVRASGFGGG